MSPEPKYEAGFGTAHWLRKYEIHGVVELCLTCGGVKVPLHNPAENRLWTLWVSRCKVYAKPEMEMLRSCEKLCGLGRWFKLSDNPKEECDWFFEVEEFNIQAVQEIVLREYNDTFQ